MNHAQTMGEDGTTGSGAQADTGMRGLASPGKGASIGGGPGNDKDK
jgi:hypothetical protein